MADRYSRKLLVPPLGSTRLSYRGTETALGPHFLSDSKAMALDRCGPECRTADRGPEDDGRDGTAFKRQAAGVTRQ